MATADISRASRPLTFEVAAVNELGETLATPIAGEHALTLYLDKREVVTLIGELMEEVDSIRLRDDVALSEGALFGVLEAVRRRETTYKAAQMRIPFLVSRSGLTRMGHDIARRTGITLIGRAVGTRYLLFTGRHRFVKAAPPALA